MYNNKGLVRETRSGVDRRGSVLSLYATAVTTYLLTEVRYLFSQIVVFNRKLLWTIYIHVRFFCR